MMFLKFRFLTSEPQTFTYNVYLNPFQLYKLLTNFNMALVFVTCVCVCSVVSDFLQPPGTCVHEILQARIVDWVAMPSSKGSSQPRGSNTHLLGWGETEGESFVCREAFCSGLSNDSPPSGGTKGIVWVFGHKVTRVGCGSVAEMSSFPRQWLRSSVNTSPSLWLSLHRLLSWGVPAASPPSTGLRTQHRQLSSHCVHSGNRLNFSAQASPSWFNMILKQMFWVGKIHWRRGRLPRQMTSLSTMSRGKVDIFPPICLNQWQHRQKGIQPIHRD